MIGFGFAVAQAVVAATAAHSQEMAANECEMHQNEKCSELASMPVYRCAWCGLRGAFKNIRCEGCGAPT